MKSSHPSKIGRYEVVDRLGEGGMGVVYLATDPLLRRTVAVKILPGHDDELRERFAREARSVARLLDRLSGSVVRRLVITLLLFAGARALLKGLGWWP